MANYGNNNYPSTTSLGLPEPVERAGSYALLWVSGLFFLLTERHPNGRPHARQSVMLFGTLSVVLFLVNFLGFILGWVPLLGGLIHMFGSGIWALTGILWIVMMVVGYLSPRFTLPGTRNVRRMLS